VVRPADADRQDLDHSVAVVGRRLGDVAEPARPGSTVSARISGA
jgi:hypothetical protein